MVSSLHIKPDVSHWSTCSCISINGRLNRLDRSSTLQGADVLMALKSFCCKFVTSNSAFIVITKYPCNNFSCNGKAFREELLGWTSNPLQAWRKSKGETKAGYNWLFREKLENTNSSCSIVQTIRVWQGNNSFIGRRNNGFL